jgi:short-chain fatty acids transporter
VIRPLVERLSRFSLRWVPDPFAIALGLTVATFLICLVATDSGPIELIGNWGGRLDNGELLSSELGLWKLLTFGMQMCLILVTGHALASSLPVRRLIDKIADLPTTATQAVSLTAVVAMLCALLNWGLGLIVGALLARNVGRSTRERGVAVHYPILGAAGYTGMMVWHGGLSGSAPLTLTQTKDLVSILGRSDVQPIGLGDTLFSTLNIVMTVVLLICVPLFLSAMMPRNADEIVQITDKQSGEPPLPEPRPSHPTPAERMERSPILSWLIAGAILAYLVQYLGRIGVDRIDLNGINSLFLALGLILHHHPRAYARAISNATSSCSGIILQFPFYAGIMGMMAMSGLVIEFASAISQAAGPTLLAPFTFLSAGMVNLFVPSGGGQWAVQGSLVVQTADNLGLPLGKVVMAFAYGDEWTNMLQPFWALPLLGITGLRARDLIGYTGTLMLLVAPLFLGLLLVF